MYSDQQFEKSMYYRDDRQLNEIQITNNLARTISQLNFTLINKQLKYPNSSKINKQDFLYVCIHGNPPFKDQFKSLQLPGQSIYFKLQSFQHGKTDQELISMPTQFQEQAKLLHQRINQASKHKPIVFVYHSYGTYIFATYCHLFKNQRIIGIIDIGGAPIRFYPALKQLINIYNGLSMKQVKDNIDHLFQLSIQRNKKIGLTPYQNKYQLLGVVRSFKLGFGFNQMFKITRDLPKVLKCFIYGRRDSIFPEDMINEKTIYYSYRNLFEPHYEQRISQTYKKCFGTKADRVQQRFIYSFEGGNHSIHMQKKHKETVAKIVERYLSFLEQIYAEEQPKI